MSRLAQIFRIAAGINIIIALFAVFNFFSSIQGVATKRAASKPASKPISSSSSSGKVSFLPSGSGDSYYGSGGQVLASAAANEASPAPQPAEPILNKYLKANDKTEFWAPVGDNKSLGRREDQFDSIWLSKFDVDEHGTLDARGRSFTFGKEKYDAITVLDLNGNFNARSARIQKDLTVRGTKVRIGKAGSGDIVNTGTVAISPSGSLYWGSRILCDSGGNCGGSAYEVPLTFNNGLTRDGSTVQLGGALIESTEIENGGFNFTITGPGNVGIGSEGPTEKLTVEGNVLVSENMALGGASIDSTKILNIDANTTTGSGYNFGINSVIEQTVTSPGGYQVGVKGEAMFNSNSGSLYSFEGVEAYATKYGSSNADRGTGVSAEMLNSGSGTVNRGVGVGANITNNSTGEVTNAWALYSSVNNTNASGTLGSAVGLRISDWSNTGTVNTSYGIYIDSTIDVGATKYSIYSASTSDSYLAGRLGIGATAPADLAEIKFSSTTPNGYGLKINNTDVSGSKGNAHVTFARNGTVQFALGINGAASDDFYIGTTSVPASPRLVIKNSTGDVGIGATSPIALLDVYKSTGTASTVLFSVTNPTGSVGGTDSVFKVTADGNTYTDAAYNVSAADLAELYDPASGENLKPGDLVSVSSGTKVKKTSSAYDAKVLGVVSTEPGIKLGNTDSTNSGKIPVALSGRVPVKVSGENGPISVGDELSPSSVAGVAMKAASYGAVIGKALESFDGSGKSDQGNILVFVNLTKSLLDTSIYAKGEAVDSIDKIVASITKAMATEFKIKDLIAEDIKVKSARVSGNSVFEEDLEVQGDTKLKDTSISGTLTADTVSADVLRLSSKALGSGKIKAGDKSVKIDSSAVKDDSLIFVTLTSDKYAVISVTDKNPGENFTVSMENDLPDDVSFNWLIINKL